MRLCAALLATFAFSEGALAAFGITTTSSGFVVDAGSSNAFKFTVNSKNCDITSILYRGEEFQYSKQYTHISSGLGSAIVKAETLNSKRSSSPVGITISVAFDKMPERLQY